MKIRVGFGYDVHQLQAGAKFFIGGIQVDHHSGAIGHSDADVLIHTICDALLGAANLRDIGFHFPPSDDSYKGIDSKILLKEVMKIIREHGYSISNIDSTVALELPKLNPYIPTMVSCLANCMEISEDDLSIKATTTEKLGFVGSEAGVAAYATVLLIKE